MTDTIDTQPDQEIAVAAAQLAWAKYGPPILRSKSLYAMAAKKVLADDAARMAFDREIIKLAVQSPIQA